MRLASGSGLRVVLGGLLTVAGNLKKRLALNPQNLRRITRIKVGVLEAKLAAAQRS